MKFIISENKMVDVVKKYIDSKDYKKLDDIDKIYFYQEGNDIADIVFDCYDGFTELNFQFIDDIVNFFTIDRNTAILYIENWVEDKLEVGKVEAWSPIDYHRSELFLPKH